MSEDFEAKPPFRYCEPIRVVFDADNHRVITCDDETTCTLYSEMKVDNEPFFMCPKCGRLGQRMEEATAAQCGIEPETKQP